MPSIRLLSAILSIPPVNGCLFYNKSGPVCSILPTGSYSVVWANPVSIVDHLAMTKR